LGENLFVESGARRELAGKDRFRHVIGQLFHRRHAQDMISLRPRITHEYSLGIAAPKSRIQK
jgi:hypothetical protein